MRIFINVLLTVYLALGGLIMAAAAGVGIAKREPFRYVLTNAGIAALEVLGVYPVLTGRIWLPGWEGLFWKGLTVTGLILGSIMVTGITACFAAEEVNDERLMGKLWNGIILGGFGIGLVLTILGGCL